METSFDEDDSISRLLQSQRVFAIENKGEFGLANSGVCGGQSLQGKATSRGRVKGTPIAATQKRFKEIGNESHYHSPPQSLSADR